MVWAFLGKNASLYSDSPKTNALHSIQVKMTSKKIQSSIWELLYRNIHSLFPAFLTSDLTVPMNELERLYRA